MGGMPCGVELFIVKCCRPDDDYVVVVCGRILALDSLFGLQLDTVIRC